MKGRNKSVAMNYLLSLEKEEFDDFIKAVTLLRKYEQKPKPPADPQRPGGTNP